MQISPKLAMGSPYLPWPKAPAAMNMAPAPAAIQGQRRRTHSAMPTASTKTLVMMATVPASAPLGTTVSVGRQSWFSFTVVV